MGPSEMQYLAQITYKEGIWAQVSLTAGFASPSGWGSATYLVPIRQDLDTNDRYLIVEPNLETPTGRFQLEVRVANDVARFRLVNKDTNITYTWIDYTLEVFAQDDPTIQELSGNGFSNTTDKYLAGSSAEPWIALIQAEADTRAAKDADLITRLQNEITARTASVDAETQARIAQYATSNAALAQEVLDRTTADTTEAAARVAGDTNAIAVAEAYAIQRANHTGTQLAATISDFNSATRAQVEAELAAGSNITITPSGSGASRVLTIASTGGGGGGSYTIWDPDKPPASAHANDEEGNGTAGTVPAGWTAFNSPGGTTAFEVDGKGRIHLFIPSGSGDVLRFWYKTVSGSYTITAKLQTQHNSNYNSSGICMRDPTTGKMLVLGLQSRSVWPNYPTLIWTWWTNSTTWNGETLGPSLIDPIYVQLSWDNSINTVIARISLDGINPFKQWQLSNSWFPAGGPTQVGIQSNSQSGGDNHSYYEFWRFKAATTDTIGGSRTIITT